MDSARIVDSFESEFNAVVNQVRNQSTSAEIQQAALTLAKLHRAYKSSCERNVDPWEFAIEISDFEIAGISKQVLRQMVASGWIAHQREVILPHMETRQFQSESLHTLSKQTCFVITELGMEKHHQIFGLSANSQFASTAENGSARPRPVWDSNRRELRLGDQVVKRFRWPAEVQFAVLDRFQNLGWPDRIADPLPQSESVDPKRRLHDAIKCLNQRRESELIGFHGDGTGQGVVVRIQLPRESVGDELVGRENGAEKSLPR